MLCYIFWALSLIGSGLVVGLTQIHWLWILPICLGMFIVLNPLYFCFLWVTTLFLPKKEPIDHLSKWCQFVIWFSTNWLLTFLRVKVTLTGSEKFPDVPFVLVSNHLSNFDPIVVLCKIKNRKIAFISKESNFKIPVAGDYARNAGFLSIDRENPMNAMRTLKKAADMMKKEELIMGIYPEGTRSKTGELLEFKEGAFLLAKRANAPVVVMTTKGTNKISKQAIWKKTNVALDVLEVIDAETVKALSYSELSDHVRKTVSDGLLEG